MRIFPRAPLHYHSLTVIFVILSYCSYGDAFFEKFKTIRFHVYFADIFEDLAQPLGRGVTVREKVEVHSLPMHLVRPGAEQHGALESELLSIIRL